MRAPKYTEKGETILKKFFTTIIVTAMALFAFPFSGCKDGSSASANLDFRLYNGGEAYYIAGIGKETSRDIVIPAEHNGKPVTGVGGKSFKGNGNVVSVEIPSSIEWVGVGAFRDCPALRKVVWNAPAARVDELNDKNRVFLGSENIEEFVLGSAVEKIPGGLFAYANGSKITEITLPAGLKKVAANTFSSVNPIKINVASLKKWLAIEKTGTGAPLVAYYTLAFGGETVESLDLSGITELRENEFSGCVSVKRVTFGTETTAVARSAFAGCTAFSSASVKSGNPKFYEKCGVVYSSADNNFAIIPPALGGEIELPAGVPSVPDGAFSGTLIEKLFVPGTVGSIGKNAFGDCKSLASVTIGEGATTISDGAFGGCGALTEVTLPQSVTDIGSEVFAGSPLLSIYYRGETLPGGTGWQSLPVWLYRESAPVAPGNYWHYADDGVTPLKWEAVSNGDRANLPARPAQRKS